MFNKFGNLNSSNQTVRSKNASKAKVYEADSRNKRRIAMTALSVAVVAGGTGVYFLYSSSAATVTCRGSTLRVGANTSCVKYLRGALGMSQTTRFDNATKERVLAFQRRNSLYADGIVGPKTWTGICKAMSSGRELQRNREPYNADAIGCRGQKYRDGRVVFQ